MLRTIYGEGSKNCLQKCKSWYRILIYFDVCRMCMYLCKCVELQNSFLSLQGKILLLHFSWQHRSWLRFKFCKAEGETRMKCGYSKQAIDSCKRQTFPAESVVSVFLHPVDIKPPHEHECRLPYKRRLFNCFCLKSEIPDLHDALWVKKNKQTTFPDTWLFQCLNDCTLIHRRLTKIKIINRIYGMQ